MVNGGDLFICVVAGLAMPLALLDGYRALAGSPLHEQFSEPDVRRSVVWVLTLLLGPGLLAERMLASWRLGELSAADRINALVITLGWAGLYGFVALGLARMLLPV